MSQQILKAWSERYCHPNQAGLKKDSFAITLPLPQITLFAAIAGLTVCPIKEMMRCFYESVFTVQKVQELIFGEYDYKWPLELKSDNL